MLALLLVDSSLSFTEEPAWDAAESWCCRCRTHAESGAISAAVVAPPASTRGPPAPLAMEATLLCTPPSDGSAGFISGIDARAAGGACCTGHVAVHAAASSCGSARSTHLQHHREGRQYRLLCRAVHAAVHIPVVNEYAVLMRVKSPPAYLRHRREGGRCHLLCRLRRCSRCSRQRGRRTCTGLLA